MKKISYDRKAVGRRLQNQRKRFEWDRKFVADRIGVVEKYYGDIERGTCGMSIETLLALAELYGVSIDFLIYGSTEKLDVLTLDKTLLGKLRSMSPQQLETCRELLKLFASGILEDEWGKKAEAETEAVTLERASV